jgi:hypothetical protein
MLRTLSFRIAASAVIAFIAGTAMASAAWADDHRDFRHDRHVDRHWHRPGVVVGGYYAPSTTVYAPPMVYAPPPPPPIVGLGFNFNLH